MLLSILTLCSVKGKRCTNILYIFMYSPWVCLLMMSLVILLPDKHILASTLFTKRMISVHFEADLPVCVCTFPSPLISKLQGCSITRNHCARAFCSLFKVHAYLLSFIVFLIFGRLRNRFCSFVLSLCLNQHIIFKSSSKISLKTACNICLKLYQKKKKKIYQSQDVKQNAGHLHMKANRVLIISN